jgi:hypothetical protein
LIFDKIAKKLCFAEMKSAGLEKLSAFAGNTFRCMPELDKGFPVSGTAIVSGEYGFTFPIAKEQVLPGLKPGVYPIRAFLKQNGKTYGVQVDASGAMTVNVPWTDNNDNTWRDVYVGATQILATGTNSGSLKFVDGTNIKATWNSSNKTIQFDASGLATTTQVEEATIYWETL